MLAEASGGVLDVAAEIPALRETVAFPHRMHLGGDWYVNLADGQARPDGDQPWHALHRAARRAGDADAEAHAAAHRIPGAPAASETHGLGRLLRGADRPGVDRGPAGELSAAARGVARARPRCSSLASAAGRRPG